jgi:Chaperonin GroEL (HSP60 family)
MAASAIANIVKSSLGPVGLDKMLVDDIGVRVTYPLLFLLERQEKIIDTG